MGRGDLTQAEWDVLAPLLPATGGCGGRWADHRTVVNGVLYRLRTGVPWRDLPERFGNWRTVYQRHRRWSADGTWDRILTALQARADAEGSLDWSCVGVDSTSVRAHPDAAGATRPRGHRKKGILDHTAGEALGRSRGGLTSKVHLACDGRLRPLAVLVGPGHAGDAPAFMHVIMAIRVPRTGGGRPRTRPDLVVADKAYSSRAIRSHLRRRGIRHTIPEPLDQANSRLRKGRRGGRPVGFHREDYRRRNEAERTINRLKAFRAVATRYDQRAYVFHGTVTLAAIRLWLRP
ncbi:IS5 family transposase [Yinghuangia seranimata]|uniref:IS5 family transposase n=1 Tax=Yinghuangia seranimata TaxID=408067 RepID=UPI003CCF4DD1